MRGRGHSRRDVSVLGAPKKMAKKIESSLAQGQQHTKPAGWLASDKVQKQYVTYVCRRMKEWVLCPNNVTRPTSGKISRVVAFVLEFIVTLHDNNVKFHIHSFIVCAGAAAAAADSYLELMRSCF